MNITSASSISTLIPITPSTPSSVEKAPRKFQESVRVNLSERAQQLNRSDAQTNTPERSASIPPEKAEPAGIQFIEGYDKGGKVRAFA